MFVGGISSTTTESELHQLFSAFGNVKQTKIIQDRAGVSKGYGFVTFETEEEARRLQVQADNIMLKERKLNIAPAIKKQVPCCVVVIGIKFYTYCSSMFNVVISQCIELESTNKASKSLIEINQSINQLL